MELHGIFVCCIAQEMLQAGLIVAGFDSREGGQVFALPLGGTMVKVPFSIGEPVHAVLLWRGSCGGSLPQKDICRCLLGLCQDALNLLSLPCAPRATPHMAS